MDDDDDDVRPVDRGWVAGTRWLHALFDAADVARILGIADGSVRQYAAKPGMSPGFPPPLVRESGRPSLWTPHQIFGYILADRPRRIDEVPRLYCATTIGTAQFLHAERRVLDPLATRWQRDVAVHNWLPADGRGPVAIAYPGAWFTDGQAYELAEELLADSPEATAVALVTDVTDVVDRLGDGWPVACAVAERGRASLTELGVRCSSASDRTVDDIVVGMWGWSEVANLLRVDLPWWPPRLRDTSKVAAWRAGAPRQAIRPRSATSCPADLENVLTAMPDKSPEMGVLIVDLQRRLEGGDTVADAPPAGDLQRPGLLVAAEPRHRLGHVPPPPTTSQLHQLLHTRVDDPVIAHHAALALQAVPEMRDVVADVVTIDIADDDRGRDTLARQWIDGLRLVDATQVAELGFAYVRAHTADVVSDRYVSPNDPNAWIVETRDDAGTRQLHATVGRHVPAEGRLTELEVYDSVAFFRDTAQRIWLLPAIGRSRYGCGYDGPGPTGLLEAVRTLAANAGADLTGRPTTRRTPDDDSLWLKIRWSDPPLHISANELARLNQ